MLNSVHYDMDDNDFDDALKLAYLNLSLSDVASKSFTLLQSLIVLDLFFDDVEPLNGSLFGKSNPNRN